MEVIASKKNALEKIVCFLKRGLFLLKSEDYDFMGANIQAEYKNYKPQGDKYEQKGCMDVTFVDSKGNSFTTFEDTIYLAGF